ncbi:MAG: amidohydrolase family protein [Dehalococcoidia bacterium]|nr:amidohydrolase family protein [Dehalococcoidia bacterium]
MASSLVRGKYVIRKVTGPDSAEVVSDGALFQRDGEIVEVGDYERLRANHPDVEVIGSPRYVVMPGLVNDHFHVGLTPFQLGAPDLPLDLWGLVTMGRAYARRLDPYLDQLYGAVQMIESGTTTVQAIHGSNRGARPMNPEAADRAITAFQESGMRVSYCPSVADQNSLVSLGTEAGFAATLPPELAERFTSFMAASYRPVEETIEAFEEISERWGNRYERVRLTLAPSNVHRCSDELLVAFRELANKHKTGIHIHLQESIYQKLEGLRAWNKTPLQHLNDLGFLGPDVVCGHSVWVTDEDIEVMAATGTNVCHNASSNLRISSGIAPIGKLLQKGIRVAIGSDEAGINDDKDLLQEMRLVQKIHKAPGVETAPPTSYQVFQMATENGAYASWFGDRVGTLEPGKRADVVLLSLDSIEEPYLDPEVSIVDAVVHRGTKWDVHTVLVDGEVVMRDRKLTKIDKEGLYRELKEVLNRPKTDYQIEMRDMTDQLMPYLRRFYEGTIPEGMTPHTIYNASR